MGDIAKPKVLLSFDAEEFDIPREFGADIEHRKQMEIGSHGLEIVLNLLDELGVRATFFTTAALGERFPHLLRRAVLAEHEIASHGCTHSTFEIGDLARSRRMLMEASGAEVVGFRRPRMAPTPADDIAEAGYLYNSSENPIWLPGRYNKFFARRRWSVMKTKAGEIVTIPAAATPLVRWPLFWLSFKNVPLWWTKLMTRWVLRSDGYAALYFHPWEFAELNAEGGFGLPRYVRRVDGERLQRRLRAYVVWMRARAEFVTYAEFARGAVESAKG